MTSPMSFRLEYKRGSSGAQSMFQRQVRMQVDLNHVSTAESGPEALYAITFTLLSGESAFDGVTDVLLVVDPDVRL